jgi:hypothetical protein
MYTVPVILLIIAYTPASPFSASLAAFRFSVLSKLSNSLTPQAGKGLDELEELLASQAEELDELEELLASQAEELEELVEGEEEVEGVVVEGVVEGVEEVV